jgi:F-type H+-transporting ATPase subunit epsilon
MIASPAYGGSLGILHGHAPLMVLLGTGTLRIDHGREQKTFTVSGGFLQVVDNTVTVLSESATAA